MKVSNNLNEGMTYVSPRIKIVEIKARKVMCVSGGTEDSDEGDTSVWFKV